jgi:predicted aspartyl protease
MQNKKYSLTRSVFNSVQSFTASYNEVVKEIVLNCIIFPMEREDKDGKKKMLTIETLWDTGCGGCLISKDLVNKMGLKSHRTIKHYDSGKMYDKNCYEAFIYLPNGITVPVELMEKELSDSPVIIGMDIICRGNLFVNNVNSKTIVRFDMPEKERIIDNEKAAMFKIEEPDKIYRDQNENSIRLEYGKIVYSLRYQCKVSTPQPNTKTLKVLAAWDSGAGMSMISRSLASKLNVKIVGSLLMGNVDSIHKINTCLINIHLWDERAIPVLVGIQDKDERADLLIGMDIISLGNLLIESIGLETSLMFQLPN